jgi:preprotein translocase subunit SecF
MLQIFVNTTYDFIGKRRWGYLLSVAFILIGLASLVVKGGLAYDIDFAGGTLLQVRFADPPGVDRIRVNLTTVGLGDAVIQEYGDPREFILRSKVAETASESLRRRVEESFAKEPVLAKFEVRRIEYVGPQVGKDLQLQAVYAVLFGLAGIVAYIAFRFDFRSGIAAIVAVTHDVLVSLGALSLTNREFSLPVLAALLTIIGYSVNDKIVAYDRVRENRNKVGPRGQTFAQQVNAALNQMLARTVLTGLCVLFVTLILLFFGGKVLEDFAFALFVGVVTGTYSSVFVATPLIVDWDAWSQAREKDRRGKKAVAKATAGSASPPRR